MKPMKLNTILIVAFLLLLLVQMLNGYALNKTKLYTPSFTYCLIAGIVIVSWLAIISAWLISKL